MGSKMHIVFNHVEDWCDEHGIGLGVFSEEAFEALHHWFKWESDSSIPKDTSNAEWGKRMLSYLCRFNSKNI